MATSRSAACARWAAGALLIVLTAGPGVAVLAQTPPAAAPTAAARREARALFARAEEHFRRAEYDRAVELYRQAHRLTGLPDLLFNVAQAQRLRARKTGLLNDAEAAAAAYGEYLARPGIAYREEAEEQLRVLRSEIVRQRAEAKVQGLEAAAAEARRRADVLEARERETQAAAERQRLARAAEASRQADEVRQQREAELGRRRRHQRRYRVAALATSVVGLALVATGARYAADLPRLDRDLDAEVRGGTWTLRAQGIYDQGTAARRIAIGTLTAGGAALVTSGILTYLGFRRPAPAGESRAAGATLQPALTASSAGLLLSGWF